jgi:hypothetical protein
MSHDRVDAAQPECCGEPGHVAHEIENAIRRQVRDVARLSSSRASATAQIRRSARCPHFISGIVNSAPSFTPLGQRLVTVFVFE